MSPHSYPPHSYSPHSYSPHSYSPHSYSPHSSPHSYPPHIYSPHSYSPHSYSPHSFSPHSYSGVILLEGDRIPSALVLILNTSSDSVGRPFVPGPTRLLIRSGGHSRFCEGETVGSKSQTSVCSSYSGAAAKKSPTVPFHCVNRYIPTTVWFFFEKKSVTLSPVHDPMGLPYEAGI